MKKNLIFILLILLGLALRLYSLDKYPLWLDEVTAASARGAIPGISGFVQAFKQPPVLEKNDYHYSYNRFFVYYWKRISGNSEFYLRLSSVIFALLGLYMLYKLGNLLYGPGVARLSLFLLAVSPFHLHYSQELRSYAAITSLSLLAFYISLKITKNEKNVYWIGYILINLLIVAFNYMMLVVVLAQCVFLALNLRRQAHFPAKLVSAHLVIFSFSAGLIIFFHPSLLFRLGRPVPIELTDLPVWGQEVGISNILFTLKNFSLGYNIDAYSAAGLSISFIFFALFLAGCIKDKSKAAFTFKAVIVFFPVLFIFLFSRFVKSIYIYRYLLAVYPVYLLGVAAGLANLKRGLRYVLLAVISVSLVFSLRNYYRSILPGSHFQHTGVFSKDTDITGAIEFISGRFIINDRIFFTSWLDIPPFKFYMPKAASQGSQEFFQETEKEKMFWLDKQGNLTFITYQDSRPESVEPVAFTRAGKVDRIWLVNDLFDPKPAVIKMLQDMYGAGQKQDFKNLEVYLFSR
jgi:hypothetical protein